MNIDEEPYNSDIESDVDDTKEKQEDSDVESDNESVKPEPPSKLDGDDTDDEDDIDDIDDIDPDELDTKFENEINEDAITSYKQDDLYGVDSDEYETDEDDDNNYLNKLDTVSRQDIISDYHPELKLHNFDEIENLCKVMRDDEGVIIDPLHRTIPIVTRYEKARILGERAKQINAGANIFVNVDNSIIDGYLIAVKEFEEKKIPFIVKRPMPNGGCEYWKLEDLEML